jgi:hypothetical protein
MLKKAEIKKILQEKGIAVGENHDSIMKIIYEATQPQKCQKPTKKTT